MPNQPTQSSAQLSLSFSSPAPANALPWIVVKKGQPYFCTEEGEPWTPIGQNDAITWPDLHGAFARKNMDGVEQYLNNLVRQGGTCLRLMLEYCHGEHRYLERPCGYFQPSMVQLWDDLFALCHARGLRLLLTPYDTFWMARRWRHHPYNAKNGGPGTRRTHWLVCPKMRAAIKARLLFATQRWGNSGALFAWDLWNEVEPRHAGNSVENCVSFITDISTFLRETELRLHGRAHPQTASFFYPTLVKHPALLHPAHMHPALDFASLHFYEKGTIDAPKTTVAAALAVGRLTRIALQTITDDRPFLDSEHGPIHTFSVRRKTLPEPFDDAYFRHMQWAHLAAGGAGGGMRWPYRHPHTLTPGMRHAQQGLAQFAAHVRWSHFNRKNLNEEVTVSCTPAVLFACGNGQQALLFILRNAAKKGRVKTVVQNAPVVVDVPGLRAGRYAVLIWDTVRNAIVETQQMTHTGNGVLCISLPQVFSEVALYISRIN